MFYETNMYIWTISYIHNHTFSVFSNKVALIILPLIIFKEGRKLSKKKKDREVNLRNVY